MVLRGLDFQIKQGEIFALLGVNGAGKTTTLECIEGLRKYDEGTIVVNGKTGIQLQSSSLPAHIKPIEAIKLFAKWNHTYIDNAMLKALGIKEMKESQYIESVSYTHLSTIATVNSSKFILFLHVFPLSNVSVSKTRLLRHDRPQVHNRSSFLFSPYHSIFCKCY